MSTAPVIDPLQKADEYLDGDTQVKRFTALGEQLYGVFRDDSGRVSSQVRNLQQLVVSARRLADT